MNCAIFGAGTYGEVYCSYLKKAGIEICAFMDDNQKLKGKRILDIPIIGGKELFPILAQKYDIEALYCPIGNNRIRVSILENAKKYNIKTPSFIEKTANISPDAIIGNGVYILANATVMPFVKLDDYVMVSMSANIAHHSHLKKGTFVSTGVNFGASIVAEENTYVGIGATIMTGIHLLGKDCKIGAGAVVIRDVEENAVVAGIPAKVIKYN